MSIEMTVSSDGTRVILEATNEINGCLEQGGVAGRKVSYAAEDVARVLGCEVADVEDYEADDPAPGYDGIMIYQAIRNELGDGHVVRTGHKID